MYVYTIYIYTHILWISTKHESEPVATQQNDERATKSPALKRGCKRGYDTIVLYYTRLYSTLLYCTIL